MEDDTCSLLGVDNKNAPSLDASPNLMPCLGSITPPIVGGLGLQLQTDADIDLSNLLSPTYMPVSRTPEKLTYVPNPPPFRPAVLSSEVEQNQKSVV